MKVLVLGNYRQTITVVRSLARAGHSVVLGASKDRGFAELSRYVDEVWNHPEESHREAFLSALTAYLKAHSAGGLAVFPVGELQIERATELAPEIRALARFVMAEPQTVALCLDKAKTSQLARELGIPIPETRIVHGRQELLGAEAAPGFPLIVKRKDSSKLLVGRKAQICVDRVRLTWLADQLKGESSALMVQHFVAGHRVNCQFLARAGKLVVYFEQRVIRTDAPDGTGYGVESVSIAPTPELKKHCESLVERLGYHGPGCVQFMVDESSSRPSLLELNPRLDASCALASFCGVDFPRLALDEDAAVPTEAYPVGVRTHWLHGDVMGLARSIQAGDLAPEAAATWLLKSVSANLKLPRHLTWDWRDPVPSIYLYFVNTPSRLLKRLKKG